MTPRTLHTLAVAVLALAASAACRTGPASQPGDPMLDAIRAKERGGDLTYRESQGQHLFLRYCATCHGDEGRGDGQNASNLEPPPPDLTGPKSPQDVTYLTSVITQGSAAVGRSPLSPPWGRSLTHQQIEYLVVYCQSLGRKKPA
ncbi:MAG: c-type cytochrome [Acidobacteria bacterium]|nr:c-type cytochrome [Acidobacteriota bacterium]